MPISFLWEALHNKVFPEEALLHPQPKEDLPLSVLQQSVRPAVVSERTLIHTYQLTALCVRC